jgi:lysophospholipase L1-like esterase
MFDPTQRALPLYVIGDSHSLPYKNMLFPDKWTGQWIITRSKYIAGLTAHDFFNLEAQEFLPSIIECLEYEGLIRDGSATHLSKDEIDFSIAKASGLPITPPLMLFTLGDIDIRGVLLRMFSDKYDFVPPFDLPYPLLDRPIIPWDVIAEIIEERLAPLVEGLKQLRIAGFNRIYVQLVVPPTTDENRSSEINGISCPLPVRTKLVASFNRLLAERVNALDVPVIDIWPQITGKDGYLLHDYELDGVHLAPRAAKMHLEQVLEHAINRAWESVNHVRHEMFYRMACGLAPLETRTGNAP